MQRKPDAKGTVTAWYPYRLMFQIGPYLTLGVSRMIPNPSSKVEVACW